MNEVLKINNSYINNIISSNFPIKELLTEGVIIAGGFPLAVFLAVESTKEEFLPLLLKRLCTGKYAETHKHISYSDIDLWVKEGYSNSLVESLLKAKLNNPLVLGNSCINKTKESKWANTFSISSSDSGILISKNMQLIKVKHKSPEDLISTFDLNICKVAWCNGELFVSKDVMKEISSCEFSFSPLYNHGEENFPTRLYRSLRYIKYAKRYNLEPSEEICQYLFNTIIDSTGENLKYSEPEDSSVVSIYNYKKEPTRTHFMYHNLISSSTYFWLSNCKNFKKDWSLFLINHPYLKTTIESIIDNKNKIPPTLPF